MTNAGSDTETLVEVQNEETYAKELLMWIDSATPMEDTITLVGFLVVLVLTILTGTNGPNPITSQRSMRPFTNGTSQSFTFDAAPVSAYNRFLKFELAFVKLTPTSEVKPVDFDYKVSVTYREGLEDKINKKLENFAMKDLNVNETTKLLLFDDHYVDYQAIELVVTVKNIDKSTYNGIAVYTSLGSHDHTTYIVYFKTVYSVFQLVALYMMMKRIGWKNLSPMSMEQKLTIPLLILGPLSNNIFYIFHVYTPRVIHNLLDSVLTPVFHGFVYFTVLVLFQSLRKKDTQLTSEIIIQNGIVAGVGSFGELVLKFRDLFRGLTCEPSLTQSEGGFASVLVVLSGLVIVGALVRMIFKAWTEVDVTERFKFFLYLVEAVPILALTIVINIVGRMFGIWHGTVVEYVATFVVHNCVVLVNIYFHWPYELHEDQSYLDGPGKDNDGAIADIDDDFDDAEEDEDSEEEDESDL